MPVKSLLTADDKKRAQEALENELKAHLTYRQFSASMRRAGYFGASAFFDKESADEMAHYKNWEEFMDDRGDIASVPKTPGTYLKPSLLKTAFEEAYQMELELGEFYEGFYEASDDPTVKVYVQQYIEIQRKSVGEYGDLLARLERCGDNQAALLVFDTELKG
jgi:ferritin